MSYNRKTLPSTMHDDSDAIVEIGDDSTVGDAPSMGETSLAKNETKAVYLFRILLMIMLISTALAVSLTAFFLIRQGEQDDFESAFEGHASKILETFESEAEEKRTAIAHMSRDLTSHAQFANATWPFVTLPDFEMKTRLTLELAEVIAIFMLPIVTKENLAKWSDYTLANQAWYWKGMEIQQTMFGVNATTSGVEHFDDPEDGLQVPGDIIQFESEGPDERLVPLDDSDEGPFFPVWQYSPQVPVPVINADFGTLPDAENEIKAFVTDQTRRTVAGPTLEFEAGSGGAVFLDLLLERYQGGGNQYLGGPLSYYYIPVYESFDTGAQLVALLMAFIYWQTYFEKLLPETAQGIHIVLENTCGQVHTFEVSGSAALFLGYEDMHDTEFDYLEASTDYGAFLQSRPENNGGCYYRLRVYPTQRFKEDHCTNRPVTICLSILSVFVFTTVVFILYDRFVEQRQRLVLKSAKLSGDVVSNLFPETVRERLYEKDRKHLEPKPKGQFLIGNTKASTGSDGSTSTDPLPGANPIADEYMNCTVFFADLAGFTKWSSTRTPSEVFQLLETLYGAFDKIAKRLGVFKVETIGDCYVAVTGLPIPQDNHALVMCKFAASCVFKMNQIVNGESILLSLGDDTANLEMRVGMHSGAVTAGVLRGEKARFQLFGDTVNVASRMESNGQKGRMQVSQATADLLITAGKSKWLTAREHLVEAKGKGSMQCFWVDITSDQSMKSSLMSSSLSDAANPLVFEVEAKPAPPQEGFDDEVSI